MCLKIRFKKITPVASMPKMAHAGDAGFDLTAVSLRLGEHGELEYGTGLAIELPPGYVGLLFPRSSIVKKGLYLTNSVGVLDSSYRGEILFKFKPAQEFTDLVRGNVIYKGAVGLDGMYKLGERIGQLIVLPYPAVEFEEAAELSVTRRGFGGFGSTGR